MAVIRVSAVKNNLPPIIKIGKKIFKVKDK